MRWANIFARSLIVLAGAALPLCAQAETLYISDEGLCDAPGEEHEMQHTIFLTDTAMENHFFGCEWDRPLGPLLAENGSAEITARCGNGLGNWAAQLEFVPQTDGYLAVFQDWGGISPVKFHECAPTVDAKAEEAE